MKFLILLSWFVFSAMLTLAQGKETKAAVPDKRKEMLVVEAACGQCKLGMPGKSCDLAIRLNGRSYFVDGTNIDSHGDAHSEDGFCKAIRKANVQGELIADRFKVTYFQLIPEPAKTEKTQ